MKLHKRNFPADHKTENEVNRQGVAFIRANRLGFDYVPGMSYEELIMFAAGSYRLKLTRPYRRERGGGARRSR
ncbi:hypothetical protein EVAR_65089_1 [Eumeta japonica]|uniref:Uncharacterized protein n=1 Tax=Eumeta variegata TaxID=151549 RepID=A0A4C1Z3T8_EUMVA|nr:hypothetical protein EVAR_65089_1 [Eumeta japonica]